MKKILTRIVALVLVPCLIVEPVFGQFRAQHLQLRNIFEPRGLSPDLAVFASQALAAESSQAFPNEVGIPQIRAESKALGVPTIPAAQAVLPATSRTNTANYSGETRWGLIACLTDALSSIRMGLIFLDEHKTYSCRAKFYRYLEVLERRIISTLDGLQFHHLDERDGFETVRFGMWSLTKVLNLAEPQNLAEICIHAQVALETLGKQAPAAPAPAPQTMQEPVAAPAKVNARQIFQGGAGAVFNSPNALENFMQFMLNGLTLDTADVHVFPDRIRQWVRWFYASGNQSLFDIWQYFQDRLEEMIAERVQTLGYDDLGGVIRKEREDIRHMLRAKPGEGPFARVKEVAEIVALSYILAAITEQQSTEKSAAPAVPKNGILGLSMALWPGRLMVEVLKGPWYLAQAVATDDWAFLQSECKEAYNLALKGDMVSLTHLIVGQWGPDVETAVHLTQQLTNELKEYKAKQGLGNGAARSQAKRLLDPLIKALTLSHKDGLFRKGHSEALPPTREELADLEQLFKDLAKPLYELFTVFYGLPSNRRVGFEARLADALIRFTDAHKNQNLSTLDDDQVPAGTPYLVGTEPDKPAGPDGALPGNRMSKDKPTYIFLDADNFIYQGTYDLVSRIYGEVYWRAQKHIPLDDETRHPTETDLLPGIDFAHGTMGTPEVDHFPSLLREVGRSDEDPAPFMEFFKTRFREQYAHNVRLVDRAEDFLKWLDQKKKDGYPIKIYLLSLSSDLAVDLISKHLGIRPYLNGVIGVPLAVGPTFRKSDKIVEIVKKVGHPCFVAMGGDSHKDVETAKEATRAGVETFSFAAPTGLDSESALRSAGADLVVRSLSDIQAIEAAFLNGPAAPSEPFIGIIADIEAILRHEFLGPYVAARNTVENLQYANQEVNLAAPLARLEVSISQIIQELQGLRMVCTDIDLTSKLQIIAGQAAALLIQHSILDENGLLTEIRGSIVLDLHRARSVVKIISQKQATGNPQLIRLGSPPNID